MLEIIIAILLVVSGSIGVNYYNRLSDCDSSSVDSNEFGRIFSIVSIVLGVLYIAIKIAIFIAKVAA